jgi:hypothetical protein
MTTKTHQKRNPYLYVPTHSAQPFDMIAGVIFGTVCCYYGQTSHKYDFIYFIKLFFQRLLSRCWDPSYIKPTFHIALHIIQNQTNFQNNTNTQPKRNQLFIPFNYHPSDIPCFTIRKVYEDELMDVLNQELYPD